MSDRLRKSQSAAMRGESFAHWCEYSGPQWEGDTRCANCGGFLRSRATLSHNRESIARAIRAAFPAIGEAHLSRATGAAARAMLGATDTGAWHGPLEGIISENGYALTTTPNGIHSAASWRMARRATEACDIGTLRFIAREQDRAGATVAAAQTRDLASMFADSAAIDAYCALSAGALTSEHDAAGFVGPAIGEAYHAPTDTFVDVVGRDDHAVLFRSVYSPHADRCAPAFLRDVLTGGNELLASYVYGA